MCCSAGYKKSRGYLFVSVLVALFVDNDNGANVEDDVEEEEEEDEDDDDDDDDDDVDDDDDEDDGVLEDT